MRSDESFSIAIGDLDSEVKWNRNGITFSRLSGPPMAIRRTAVERRDPGIFKTSSLVNRQRSIER
jgi:hypothetical protein